MKYSINEIFDFMSSEKDIALQAKGIEEAKKVKYISIFLRPIESKLLWENCAKVIASKSDHELKRLFEGLFEWLQDMTWPGATIIYDRLLLAKGDEFLFAYKHSLEKAYKLEDDCWIEPLESFWIEYKALH